MKRIITVIALCLVTALICVTFAGCGENTKQKAIATELSSEISSNGGLAVRYGKYLYFINGLAEEDADNTFGDVVMGAIARAEYDTATKTIKRDTRQIIVPKKVFGKDTNENGITIVDNYIYYTTTSLDKDGEGEYKTGELVLMRTKVDGTDTKEIKKFEGDSIVYRVVKGSVLYINTTEQTINKIDLNSKKFSETLIAEDVGSTYFFTPQIDNQPMNNYLFYQKTDETNRGDVSLYAVSFDGSVNKKILDSAALKPAGLEKSIYYTISVSSFSYAENHDLVMFYTLSDNGLNTPSVGLYSYSFNKDLTFDREKQVRYTYNASSDESVAYTANYVFDEGVVLCTTKKVDVYTTDGKYSKTLLSLSEAITVFNIRIHNETEAFRGLYLTYNQSSAYKRLKLANVSADGVIDFSETLEDNVTTVFSETPNTTWLSPELIDGNLYYINSTLKNHISYYPFGEESQPAFKEEDTRKSVLFSILTDAEKIALGTDESSEKDF